MTGARTAWPAGAQGIWQPAGSSERDRHGEVSGHKALLSLVNRAAEGPSELRLRQEVLR